MVLSARKFANMRDDEQTFQTNLERCTYRFLQQTAKAMGLPSNVKKVYLIQLINTKNYGTPEDLNSLVQHIREEQHQNARVRKNLSKIRKKKNEQQSPEISSTSNGQSPPITRTVKRTGHFYIQYSFPNSPIKYHQAMTSRRIPVSSSDRVLRSSNRVTKPSYLLNNTLMSIIKDSDSDERHATKVKIISTEENKRKASRVFAKKIIQSFRDEETLVSVPRTADISPALGKPLRRLSGVYPLQPEDIRVPSVTVRRADGSISKLKAIIQKPLPNFNDRQTQTDKTNWSLLNKYNTPTPVKPLQTVERSSINYQGSNFTFRSSNGSDMTSMTPCLSRPLQTVERSSINYQGSNFTFRSSNGSDMTSMTPCLSRPLQTVERSSINYQGSDFTFRSSNGSDMTSMTPCLSRPLQTVERSSINCQGSNFTFRSSNVSDMTSMTPCLSRPSTTPNIVIKISQENAYKQCNVTYKELSPMDSFLPTNSSASGSSSNSGDETTLSNISKDNNSGDGEYYHKKIRAELVRTARRSREMAKSIDNEAVEAGLPKINEVFSKFSGVYNGDVTQPLYVQASIPQYTVESGLQYQGRSSLEMIYNLNMQPQPTQPICTTTNTHAVYRTPVMSTAVHVASSVAQPSTAVHSTPPEEQPFFMNDNEAQARADDFFSNFHYHDHCNIGVSTLDFSRACSSVGTLESHEQELGANVTIPEMVEDALEIISQDGDYMERMGMDIRVQCILCNWAGPKIILEHHIRKDHSSEIVECSSNEFNASYTLGGLSSRSLWHSDVLQHDGAIYVLSAKYEDPDYFMATLTTVSYDPDDPKLGSMTVYNKVTGQPFTWTGVVTDLPACMPYENNSNCFKLQLSQMDLLPNSANLRLLNRELVLQSPTKVVVGQPELDNIKISLTVKIYN